MSTVISSNEINIGVNDSLCQVMPYESDPMLSVGTATVLQPRDDRGAYLQEITNIHDYFCFYHFTKTIN